MVHHSVGKSLLGLARSFKRLDACDPLAQCLAPRLSRGLTTTTTTIAEPSISIDELPHHSVPESLNLDDISATSNTPESLRQTSTTTNTAFQHTSRVLTTLYSWPQLEPQQFAWYNSKYLDMPLRRDILHRAVVFEGDSTRQGTASTKWRTDVHGSNRKLYQQKGTGRARAGDKKSPSRRGGGVAFGPKPRDFSTELQRKVYDVAFRTALSHRYRKGELIVLADQADVPEGASPRFLANFFEMNQWGRGNGRSLLVTNSPTPALYDAMAQVGEHGLAKDIVDVDVKDLLETGRIIVERRALHNLIGGHSSDLGLNSRVDARYNWLVNEQNGTLRWDGYGLEEDVDVD